jgi:hypothetical protein
MIDFRKRFIEQFTLLSQAFENKLTENDTRGCQEIMETEILLYNWIDGLPEPELKKGEVELGDDDE